MIIRVVGLKEAARLSERILHRIRRWTATLPQQHADTRPDQNKSSHEEKQGGHDSSFIWLAKRSTGHGGRSTVCPASA